MANYFWNIYGWVYDAALLELIPYQNMLRLAGEALAPRKGGVYFDAGCGTGNLIAVLHEANNDIVMVGADSSSVMLTRALKKTTDRKGSIAYHEIDLNKEIPFESNSFDGATCINVLYVIDQPGFLIKELRRVLKKKGRLIIATPLDEPKLMPVISEHIEILKVKYPKRWVIIFIGQIIRNFVPAIASILLNLIITRNKKYLFFVKEELIALVEKNGFQLIDLKKIYGRQVLFMCAEKR